MFSAAARLRTVRRIFQQASLPAPAARGQNKPSLSAKAIAISLPTWRFLLSWPRGSRAAAHLAEQA
jgi:hypothetical protein